MTTPTTRTKDATAILQGEVTAYIAQAGTSAPTLGEPFTEAVTGSHSGTTTLVLAQIERGDGHDFLKNGSTPTAPDGFTAADSDSGAALPDLFIEGDGTAAPTLQLSEILWNPAGYTTLTIEATRFTTSPTADLFGLVSSPNALFGKSAYFHYKGKTAEFPFTLAIAGSETAIEMNIPNTEPWLEARAVMATIKPGNHYRFRIADEDGIESVQESNAGWARFADQLFLPEGFGITFERETTEQGILADTAMVDAYVINQANEITFSMLDFRLEPWKRLMNDNPVVDHPATATHVGYRELSMELSGGRAKQFSLFLLGSSPYGDAYEGGMWWPRVYVSAVGQVTESRAGSNVPVTIRTLRDYITGHVGMFLYQTAAKTS